MTTLSYTASVIIILLRLLSITSCNSNIGYIYRYTPSKRSPRPEVGQPSSKMVHPLARSGILKPKNISSELLAAEAPKKRRRLPGMQKLTGKITKQMCSLPRYSHLRYCHRALNPTKHPPNQDETDRFLCKEKSKYHNFTRQAEHRGGVYTTRFTGSRNPCTSSPFPYPIEIIEAEDMNGNTVELYQGVDMYQVFYKKECRTVQHFDGLECSELKVVVETAIYMDDGDNDPSNDPIETHAVQISLDCALQIIES